MYSQLVATSTLRLVPQATPYNEIINSKKPLLLTLMRKERLFYLLKTTLMLVHCPTGCRSGIIK